MCGTPRGSRGPSDDFSRPGSDAATCHGAQSWPPRAPWCHKLAQLTVEPP
jgi:hypothetical protein